MPTQVNHIGLVGRGVDPVAWELAVKLVALGQEPETREMTTIHRTRAGWEKVTFTVYPTAQIIGGQVLVAVMNSIEHVYSKPDGELNVVYRVHQIPLAKIQAKISPLKTAKKKQFSNSQQMPLLAA